MYVIRNIDEQNMQKQQYVFLTVLVVAALSDLIVPIFIGTKYSGYNHFYDTISTLGTNNSPVKEWEGLNLMFVGVLLIVFAFGQRLEFKNTGWSYNWYFIGIVAFGIGSILAGIFSEDPKGVEETVDGKIHGISSGIGFILLILCPLWALFIRELNSHTALNVFFLIGGISTFILFLLSENVEDGILKYTGLYQRVNLVLLYSALIVNYTFLTKRIPNAS